MKQEEHNPCYQLDCGWNLDGLCAGRFPQGRPSYFGTPECRNEIDKAEKAYLEKKYQQKEQRQEK